VAAATTAGEHTGIGAQRVGYGLPVLLEASPKHAWLLWLRNGQIIKEKGRDDRWWQSKKKKCSSMQR
jgi:hypothetical protein